MIILSVLIHCLGDYLEWISLLTDGHFQLVSEQLQFPSGELYNYVYVSKRPAYITYIWL